LYRSAQKANAKDLLFKVVLRDSGHEYNIYTTGEIEGFGDDALVFNYFDPVASFLVGRVI
jgi:hypothetical protein